VLPSSWSRRSCPRAVDTSTEIHFHRHGSPMDCLPHESKNRSFNNNGKRL
jgi:hypothetical protein